jgi:hypothetical protein
MLSDVELFGDVPTTRPRSAVQATDRGGVVLDTLLAAGLKPPFGFDTESAEQLWGTALGHYPKEILAQAASEWITDSREFPALSEFSTVVHKCVRDAQRAERETHTRGQSFACRHCRDLQYIDHTPDQPAQHVLSPCPDCNSGVTRVLREKPGWRPSTPTAMEGVPMPAHIRGLIQNLPRRVA